MTGMKGKKRIVLLGATGSIGTSTLDVVNQYPDEFEVVGMAAGQDWKGLQTLATRYRPAWVSICDNAAVDALKNNLPAGVRVVGGPKALLDQIAGTDAEICVSAIVGSVGLPPTLAAIEAGMHIALANKEVLVAAGALVTATARAKGVRLLPVDSEHSALFQCLHGEAPDRVRRLVLTASGGPFRGFDREQLDSVSPADALAHPTWRMGQKVTIDSASLANKALEVIEAHWLFGVDYDRIDVMIHPQSLIHSMVEFKDGSMLAQLSKPDMRLPIQYALSWPERFARPQTAPTLAELSAMTFEAPDRTAFPMLDIGIDAGRTGGLAPAVFSAANEEAVSLFLQEQISFSDISKAVKAALTAIDKDPAPDLSAILRAEEAARFFVRRRFAT